MRVWSSILLLKEDAGKTVADLSGNGQDGKLEGDTSWTDGKFGKAVNFGGKNGIVSVEHSDAFEFTDGITIAAWILPTLKAGPRHMATDSGEGT